MKFKLEIETDNAAFEDGPESEVARILRALAARIENEFCMSQPVFDINGNRVGRSTVEAS